MSFSAVTGLSLDLETVGFEAAPYHQVAWDIGVYGFVTTFVGTLLVSALACLFLRCLRA